MPALKKLGAAALSAFGFGSGGAATVIANYLVVAGGGGGGSNGAGGGGAGGYQANTTTLTTTLSYTVIVGAGGTGGTNNGQGNNGSNSSFGSLTASVGGGGGGGLNFTSPTTGVGKAGGSGGGGGSGYGIAGGAGGSGTSGQGNNGGTGVTQGSESVPNLGGGGGGGASAAGSNGSLGTGGAGGNGTASSISGSSVTYAGGGAGGSGTSVGSGGTGGGGSGAGGSTAANNGTANLGGGGGGGGNPSTNGAQGGSGIVIISYTGAQQFGGGVVTTAAGNTIHTFYTSGTLSPLSSLSANYLIVAGGGGGGASQGAGGGAGGMQTGSALTIDTNSTYVVTVGAGGTGAVNAGSGNTAQGSNGSASSFSAYATSSVGGGGAGTGDTLGSRDGKSGGSGGGSSSTSNTIGTPGSGTSGQGNSGGSGNTDATTYRNGGGGGGAGQAGGNSNASITGYGGNGSTSSISGTATYYAGGGAGGWQTGGSIASAGLGGGGTGGSSGAGGNGGTNLGGGGGGGGYAASGQNGGNGGSGIVIISYAGSTQQMAGGNVTITGGNVIHTFTSSGYLTPLTYFGNSLRWRSSASAYLSRTPATTGNQQKWTFSAWVKIGPTATSLNLFSANGAAATAYTDIRISYTSGSMQLNFDVGPDATRSQNYTTAVFRDPAAWYHMIVAVDTTQATAANRVLMYVNGIAYSYTSTATIPQNLSTNMNLSGTAMNIGRRAYGSDLYFDGYMTNINFIDGQALGPNSFGTFNSYGVWQPITYGGSYGTNGFYLPFTTNASGYSGSFSGSNYLALTDSSNTMDLGSSTSLEFFYYPTSLANLQGLFMKGGGGNSWSVSNGIYYDVIFTTGGIFTTTYNAGGSAGTLADTTARALNRWYHVVLASNSTTLSLFVNGVRVATAAAVPTKPTTRTTVDIGTTFAGGENALGLISNMRFISGSNAYDASATRINVPTTTLTAVTGTQLLTLQNSTIIDNSTNGFTITNTGSVTTGQTYPLATAVFDDQSPQGNNWTPNNISGNIGSTLDYMVDVPTLTSANVANYAVVNPLSKQTDISATNGNLSISLGTVSGGIRKINATIGLPSTGKFYWESLNTGTTNVNMFCGIQTYTASLSSIGTGDIFYNEAGEIQNNGVSSGTIYGTLTAGDTLAMAYDADANKLYFYKNGTLQNSGGTTPSFTGPYIPFFGMYITNNGQAINFGQQPFKYTPPSGYVALNTYNM